MKDAWRGNICGPFQCYRTEGNDICWDNCLGEMWPRCPYAPPPRRERDRVVIIGES
jgi:hypothetical protein